MSFTLLSDEKRGNSNCAGDLYLYFLTVEIKDQESNFTVFFLFFFFLMAECLASFEVKLMISHYANV